MAVQQSSWAPTRQDKRGCCSDGVHMVTGVALRKTSLHLTLPQSSLEGSRDTQELGPQTRSE